MLSPLLIIFWIFVLLACWRLAALIVKSISILTIKEHRPKVQADPVSIIVCTRNEEENLKELLPLLLHQDHPNFEVIIVLDRCFDKSLDYLKELEPQHRNLRTLIVDYVPDQFHPKKFGLTLAIKGAKHEWVLLTDADCRPNSSSWARKTAELFEEGKEFVLGFGPYEKQKGSLNHFIQYETWQTAFEYFSMARLGMPYMGVGRNLAYKKSTFLKSRGFNEFQSITGGDDDLFVQQLANKRNTALAVGYDVSVVSKPKTKWADYWKQKKRHLSVGKYYKKSIVLRHLLKSQVHLWLWLSFIILAIWNYNPLIIWPAMVILMIIQGLFSRWSAQKLGQGYQYWITPFLDFTYALFIPIIGTVAFFRKNIKWK